MNDFVINFKARLRNWAWWATVIPGFFAVLSVVLRCFGVYNDLTEVQNGILAIGEALFSFLALVGVNVDPTTKGLGDSAMAQTYVGPKDDTAPEVTVDEPMVNIEKIISEITALALDQVGYLGKKTDEDLDKKTANPGGFFNKYWGDLDTAKIFNGKKNGAPWCTAIFWVYWKILGAKAIKLFGMPNASANKAGYVTYMREYLIAAGGQYVSVPQPGDFEVQGDDDHCAYVTSYDGQWVRTVSFNCKSVQENGGGVGAFAHGVAHKDIKCYVRPNWELLNK